jgi:hypothetical protein
MAEAALAFTHPGDRIQEKLAARMGLEPWEYRVSSNDRKKQRHEQKRRQKRAAFRRSEQGGNPYRRIGTAGSVAACYINSNWRQEGLASIRVLLRVPGGGHALAAFLVDLLCIGLKDAFGHLDVTAQEFEEHILHAADEGLESVRVPLDSVRPTIAGAIRWSHEQNFRLPPRYERVVAMIGGVGDWHTADISGFGVDGKLRYVGELRDLERRLIGTTLDEFLSRDDVELIGGLGPSALDEGEDAEMVEEAVQLLQERALDAVRQWCFANGIQPHPRLADAVDIMLTGLIEAPPAEGEDIEEEAAASRSNLERLLSLEAPESEAGLRDAVAQVSEFIKGFSNPDELAAALGLQTSDIEEEEGDE